MNYHVIAAFISFKEDYHFYSLDSDGLWSHKLSHFPVEKIDRKLDDPSKQLRDSTYNKFLGFYKVPETGIQYYRHHRHLD